MKATRSIILTAIIVVLGLLIACIPKFIFPICESDNLGFFSSYQPVMRCFWVGRIELFLGGLVVLSGMILLFRPTPDTHFTIGALLVGLGLVTVLVSVNTVIGSTCGHARSICQIGTKPAERIAGSLATISGLLLMLFSSKK